MINLLPPETKQAYYYASSNQRLLKWVVALAAGLIGLALISTYGWVTLHQSITSNAAQVSQTENGLTKNSLVATDQRVLTISNDFRLVVKVLSQEVLFSKLLSKMAAAMPSGANLTDLNITNTASGSGLDITAEATDYTTASQVEVNLADPSNGIFTRADIVSITCTPPQTGTNQQYPCIVAIRAQFAQNNQFLFINQGVL